MGSEPEPRPPMRGGPAEQMLFALAWFDRPVYVREIATGLDLSRSTVRHGLRALALLGFATAGPRTRQGRSWSLTTTGAILAARFIEGARS